ncbi:MAG: tetratricopeptide repeat protein [Treponema sp.]|nr:tetratricopeptide repeat protein [Treponema sp.]
MKKNVLLILFTLFACFSFAKSADYVNEQYEAFDKDHKYEEIISSIKSVDESSYSTSDYFYLGLAYFRMENDSEAEKYFRIAVQMDPGYFRAYDYLSGCCYFLGKYEDTISFCQKCIELDASIPRPYKMIAYAYEKIGDLSAAVENFSKFYDFEKDPMALYHIAYDLFEMEDYKKARSYAEKYLKQDKDSFYMNNLMIMILYASADYKTAAKYEKILRKIWESSDDPEIKNQRFFLIHSFQYKEYYVEVYEKLRQDEDFYYPLTCNVVLGDKVIKSVNLEYDAVTGELSGWLYFIGIDEVESKTHYTSDVWLKKYPKFPDFIKYVKMALDGELEFVSSSTVN